VSHQQRTDCQGISTNCTSSETLSSWFFWIFFSFMESPWL